MTLLASWWVRLICMSAERRASQDFRAGVVRQGSGLPSSGANKQNTERGLQPDALGVRN